MIKKIIYLFSRNKSYYYVLVGLFASAILSFSSNVLLARNFKPEEYGLFFSLLTLAMLFANLNVSGIPLYLQDLISKKIFKKNSYYGKILLLIILLFSAIYYSFYFLWILYGPNDNLNILILYIFSFLIIFQPFIEMSKSLLQIDSQFKKLSILNFLINLLRFLLLIFLVLYFSKFLNLLNVSYVFVASTVIPFFISIYIFFNYFNINLSNFFKFEKNILRSLKNSLINIKFYFSSNILYFIFISTDILVIKYFLSDFHAGIFFASFSIILGMQLFSEATVRTFSYQYFKKSKFNKNKLKIFLKKNILFLLNISIPMCIFVFFFSELIINILYGENYKYSSKILKILIFIIPLKLIATNLSLLVITIKKSLYNTVAMLIITSFKIPLMILLISFFDLIGAVFSLIIIEIFYLIILNFIINKYFFLKRTIYG